MRPVSRWMLAGTILIGVMTAGPVVAARAQSGEGAGANLSGCSGSATSFDKDGEEKDRVEAPGGPESSPSRPFHVSPNGTVNWEGSSDAVITDLDWGVKLFGVTVQAGSGANRGQKTSDNGVENVDDYLPFKVTGLYHVDFNLEGDGGACAGEMWVKLDGNPFGTVPWFAGAVLVVAGAAGLWWARPTADPGTPAGGVD